ncbi:MAG: hypothetical protein AMS27_12115 [Bacteroides sp. SM23_62_1]|nr:MAG: hypothetical protein AMS27_12115 [Bacteroides sp. SM23_62_1]
MPGCYKFVYFYMIIYNFMRRVLLFIGIILISFFACKKGDLGPNLEADAGSDTTAQVGDTMRLDASGSLGHNYEIIWTITSQPSNDTVTYSQSDSAFFIPSKNGTYTLKLRISKDNEFSEDYKTVVVAGAIPLQGTLLNDITLTKINTSQETDYTVRSDLTVSALMEIDQGVIIEFAGDAGLIISETGMLFAENVSFIAADDKWKGIHLKGPRTVLVSCIIRDAGSSSFTTETTDNASVILTGNAVASFSGNTFESSGGFGLVVRDNAVFKLDNILQVHPLANNKFVTNASGPMKVPAGILSVLSSPNFTDESEGTYLTIYQSTYASTETASANISDFGIPYKFTGPVKFNKPLIILPGVEVYFTRTAGMIITGDLNINGSSSKPVKIDGFTSTTGSWNGIYVKSGNTLITYTSILNAGYRALEGLAEPAILTVEGTLNIQNSQVSGSSGIGIFLKDQATIQYAENFSGNTLQNNMTSAIRLAFDDVHKIMTNNTISAYSSSVPAIEVRDGKTDFLGTWKNLSAEIDYLIIEDVTLRATKSMTIESGSNLKFTAGSAFNISGSLDATGVTFGGSQQTAGYWDGIIISTDDHVTFDNCNIQDGGGGTTDKANIMIQPAAVNVIITNSTITNSAGYGVIIKAGASSFNIYAPASGNTFEGTLGPYLDEN